MSVSRKRKESSDVDKGKKLIPNDEYAGKKISQSLYVSFKNLNSGTVYLPREMDDNIQLAKIKKIRKRDDGTEEKIKRVIEVPLITQNSSPIGMILPNKTFFRWQSKNLFVTSYQYNNKSSWHNIKSFRLENDKRVKHLSQRPSQKRDKTEVSLSKYKAFYRPLFISFQDVDNPISAKHLPEDIQTIEGYIELSSPINTFYSETILVQKNDDVIGIIVPHGTFSRRKNDHIKMLSYSYDNEKWYPLPESQEVAVNSIDELIKTDEVTNKPISHVFVKNNLRFKTTIPKDARLVGGAKHYEVDGKDFEQETLFVVQLRDKKPTVIGEIVPKDVVSKKSYIPHYLIENRSYYSFDTKNNKRVPTSLSDAFHKWQLAVSPKKESTPTLGIFAKSTGQKETDFASSLSMFSRRSQDIPARQLPEPLLPLKIEVI